MLVAIVNGPAGLQGLRPTTGLAAVVGIGMYQIGAVLPRAPPFVIPALSSIEDTLGGGFPGRGQRGSGGRGAKGRKPRRPAGSGPGRGATDLGTAFVDILVEVS